MSLTLYRWTESTVLPESYATTYPNSGTPLTNLYYNEGSITNPTWNLVDEQRFSILAALVQTTTVVPFTGVVNMYRNGKFDLSVDLNSI